MNNFPEEISIKSGEFNLYGKLFSGKESMPVVLLLHGLGFHSFEYDDFAPILAKQGYNCLALDFRCCGKSEGRRGYWTLADYVEDAKNAVCFLKKKFPNSKIVVYGNSLGANVAVSLLANTPEGTIHGVVAANCATRPIEFGMNPFRRVLLFLGNIVFRLVPFRLSVNRFIPYTKILTDKNIIKKIKEDKSISSARKFAISTYNDMFSWDMTKIVSLVRVPILVIQGKQDGLQSPSQSTMLYDAANEPKEIALIETGHLPNLENPELLADLVISWLQKVLH